MRDYYPHQQVPATELSSVAIRQLRYIMLEAICNDDLGSVENILSNRDKNGVPVIGLTEPFQLSPYDSVHVLRYAINSIKAHQRNPAIVLTLLNVKDHAGRYIFDIHAQYGNDSLLDLVLETKNLFLIAWFYWLDQHDRATFPPFADHKELRLVDPMPNAMKQNGSTCGYNAVSEIMQCWHEQQASYQHHPVRKRDNPDQNAPVALRKLAKNAGLTGIGGIWNIEDFKTIVCDTQYHAEIISYDTEEALLEKAELALKFNLPFILSVDFDQGALAMKNGDNAHYITVIGSVLDQQGNTHFLYTSSSQYFSALVRDIFQSTHNLSRRSSSLYYKVPGTMWHKYDGQDTLPSNQKCCVVESKDLQSIKKKMVVIYPKDLKDKYESLWNTPDVARNQMQLGL